jgi:hypothetical protein
MPIRRPHRSSCWSHGADARKLARKPLHRCRLKWTAMAAATTHGFGKHSHAQMGPCQKTTIRIKGPDDPTCQLNSNKSRQMWRWDGKGRIQKRDVGRKIAWTICVCDRVVCGSLCKHVAVWKSCMWQSCMCERLCVKEVWSKSFVWKLWVKELCMTMFRVACVCVRVQVCVCVRVCVKVLRVKEMWAKEFCVKELCVQLSVSVFQFVRERVVRESAACERDVGERVLCERVMCEREVSAKVVCERLMCERVVCVWERVVRVCMWQVCVWMHCVLEFACSIVCARRICLCWFSSGYVLRRPQVFGPTFWKPAGWYMKKRFEKCLNYFWWC